MKQGQFYYHLSTVCLTIGAFVPFFFLGVILAVYTASRTGSDFYATIPFLIFSGVGICFIFVINTAFDKLLESGFKDKVKTNTFQQ